MGKRQRWGWLGLLGVLAAMGAGAAEEAEGDDKPPKVETPPKDKGFAVESEDGRYKLGAGLQSAYKLEPVWENGHAQSRTAFPFLRPRLYGNVFRPWVQFWTSLELASAGAPYLLDSYVDLQPWKVLGVRAGQQYTPISRHESLGPQQILFPEFAPVANYFWTGRDKGLTFMGTAKALEYYAGIYGGSPLRSITSDPGRWVSNARLTVNPMGPMGYGELPYIMSDEKGAPFRVSFTVQGAGGKVDRVEENFNVETGGFEITDEGLRKFVTGGVDFMLQAQRFTFYAEGWIERVHPERPSGPNFTSVGAWAQADYVFYKKVLDAGVRLSWLDVSHELPDDSLYVLEAQLAWFVDAPFLAFKLRYQFAHQRSPDPELLGAVKLAHDPGTSNLVTLQLNLAF
ncbi:MULTISPECIES: hypothetical protein [Corallococcus]|uniref:hypothetical protein n=1 Tax=Corallococcus TaxID=83461 RepID=UPI00117C1818|nr:MULTISPECIES: hypothetical protein [Corallococcus]NBD11398.1 hypothetical protein [Corallococcus silvisoli]TSC32400.1 hypothetical protein FOF48_10195 [Corallococcus sp. Z5C101001]